MDDEQQQKQHQITSKHRESRAWEVVIIPKVRAEIISILKDNNPPRVAHRTDQLKETVL